MQEERFDGENILTDADDVKLEDFFKALHKVENKFVAFHKPSSSVRMPDGKYIVNKQGAWKKQKK